MSGIGANTTQLAKWLGAEEGKTRTTRNVKNVALGKLIDQGIGDYSGIRNAGANAFNQYYQDFLADSPAARARTGQEVGVYDRLYGTGVESDLAGLRSRASAARRNAAQLAGQRAIRGLNSSRLLGAGGPSSYQNRLLARNMQDIDVQAAMDDAAAERGDYGFLLNQRMGNAGRRQALIDAQTGRVLQPEAIRRGLYSQNLGYLGTLGDLDRANTFYGLKYDPSFAEEFGTALQNSVNTMKDIYGMGAFGGGGMPTGGGGAPGGTPMKVQPGNNSGFGFGSYGPSYTGPGGPGYGMGFQTNDPWNFYDKYGF